jgi:hypothetical protein
MNRLNKTCKMKRNTLIFSIALLISSSGQTSVSQPTLVPEDGLIRDWIGLQLQFTRNTTGIREITYFRSFAYTGVALYGAFFKAQEHRFADDLNQASAPSPPVLFAPAAVNAAIADMLRFFYGENPARLSKIDSMETAYFRKYSLVLPAGSDLSTSVKEGKKIAAKVARATTVDDAKDRSVIHTSRGDDYWETTTPAYAVAAVSNWGQFKPIISASTIGIQVPHPPLFSISVSSPFYTIAKEVRDVGNCLTTEEKTIATFWDDSPDGKHYPVSAHWFSILKQVLEQLPVSLEKAVNAYMQLGISMNDAAIYYLMSIDKQVPPVSYVHKYMNDMHWMPFLATPSHPDYITPVATISSAAAFSLQSIFGQNFHFSDHSYDEVGLKCRNFRDFEAASAEANLSLLYGGINYRPYIEASEQAGRAVAEKVDSVLRLPVFFLFWE